MGICSGKEEGQKRARPGGGAPPSKRPSVRHSFRGGVDWSPRNLEPAAGGSASGAHGSSHGAHGKGLPPPASAASVCSLCGAMLPRGQGHTQVTWHGVRLCQSCYRDEAAAARTEGRLARRPTGLSGRDYRRRGQSVQRPATPLNGAPAAGFVQPSAYSQQAQCAPAPWPQYHVYSGTPQDDAEYDQ
eukprot:TRINITY_DN18132_c0_g1_i1.p4 TRINITY_DN18132_c0_g1~~TRINITY_DN18132_c0_g1_i1.p4  ORF type:complete len:187 (+),score=29.85 TRINITY_DN18132_c0_g1_i1:146-706(+)